jgi:hypothetical protein
MEMWRMTLSVGEAGGVGGGASGISGEGNRVFGERGEGHCWEKFPEQGGVGGRGKWLVEIQLFWIVKVLLLPKDVQGGP